MTKQLKVLELFAGTRSVGKIFEDHGHKVTSVDWDKKFSDVIHADAYQFLKEHGNEFDVIWASPDCSTYSMMAGSHHRLPEYKPKTDYAKFCDMHNEYLFSECNALGKKGKLIFIENPRALMRKMTWQNYLPRYTVTYCQYGFPYMKPTDIWTTHPNPQFRPPCKNGDKCHESAPRGSKHGVQKINNKSNTSRDRAVIPPLLCEHVVKICEEYYNIKNNKTNIQRIRQRTLGDY